MSNTIIPKTKTTRGKIPEIVPPTSTEASSATNIEVPSTPVVRASTKPAYVVPIALQQLLPGLEFTKEGNVRGKTAAFEAALQILVLKNEWQAACYIFCKCLPQHRRALADLDCFATFVSCVPKEEQLEFTLVFRKLVLNQVTKQFDATGKVAAARLEKLLLCCPPWAMGTIVECLGKASPGETGPRKKPERTKSLEKMLGSHGALAGTLDIVLHHHAHLVSASNLRLRLRLPEGKALVRVKNYLFALKRHGDMASLEEIQKALVVEFGGEHTELVFGADKASAWRFNDATSKASVEKTFLLIAVLGSREGTFPVAQELHKGFEPLVPELLLDGPAAKCANEVLAAQGHLAKKVDLFRTLLELLGKEPDLVSSNQLYEVMGLLYSRAPKLFLQFQPSLIKTAVALLPLEMPNDNDFASLVKWNFPGNHLGVYMTAVLFEKAGDAHRSELLRGKDMDWRHALCLAGALRLALGRRMPQGQFAAFDPTAFEWTIGPALKLINSDAVSGRAFFRGLLASPVSAPHIEFLHALWLAARDNTLNYWHFTSLFFCLRRLTPGDEAARLAFQAFTLSFTFCVDNKSWNSFDFRTIYLPALMQGLAQIDRDSLVHIANSKGFGPLVDSFINNIVKKGHLKIDKIISDCLDPDSSEACFSFLCTLLTTAWNADSSEFWTMQVPGMIASLEGCPPEQVGHLVFHLLRKCHGNPNRVELMFAFVEASAKHYQRYSKIMAAALKKARETQNQEIERLLSAAIQAMDAKEQMRNAQRPGHALT